MSRGTLNALVAVVGCGFACLGLDRLDLGGVARARARSRGRALAGHELVEGTVPDGTSVELAIERVLHQPENRDAALVEGAESRRWARQHLLTRLLLALATKMVDAESIQHGVGAT